MEKYTVEFSSVRTYDGFYKTIIAGLQFPHWCGKNMDAIWDMLTGYMDCPVTVEIRGIKKLPTEYQDRGGFLLKP